MDPIAILLIAIGIIILAVILFPFFLGGMFVFAFITGIAPMAKREIEYLKSIQDED